MEVVTKLVLKGKKELFSISSPFTKAEHIPSIMSIHGELLSSKLNEEQLTLENHETLSVESLEQTIKGIKAGAVRVVASAASVTSDGKTCAILLKLEKVT